MALPHERIYASLRADVLARHFALGRFWRTNHFTNLNVLGETGDCFVPPPGQVKTRTCFTAPCVPRRLGQPVYQTPEHPPEPTADQPHAVTEKERWRVWNHDHANALTMTGMRLIHLCTEHRLGHPLAQKIIESALHTTGALMKYPAGSDFGGYILRWDPVSDDDWQLEIDEKGHVTPVVPCRFLLNSDLKRFGDQRYLYCTPLDDPRYLRSVQQVIDSGNLKDGQDRYRRWEPSKDEYIGLLAGFRVVFDTFSSGTQDIDVRITKLVRAQTLEIAKYLQRFAYLLVRPCKGVTARGCGEILPLLEFPFGRMFKHVLGDSFDSTASYWDVLNGAGIRPQQIAGTSVATVAAAVIAATGEVMNFLVHNGLMTSDQAGTALQPLNDTQRLELAQLWLSRNLIDAVGVDSQGEVLAGFIINALPRPQRKAAFERWLSGAGNTGFHGFKPFLAVMSLTDDDDFVRRNYLTWYDATFPQPFTPQIRSGDNDWAFASAAALRVAWRQGDADRVKRYTGIVEQQLRQMGSQILDDSQRAGSTDRPRPLLVFGAGCAPLSDQEMADRDGLSCGANAPRSVISEYHDKVGDWYGYMPVLGLAWDHLLDVVPNPFSADSGIALPTGNSLTTWPQPAVPAAVIAEAKDYPHRMGVPLAAFSRSVRSPNGQQDVLLFVDPPDRPADNDVGRRPAPRGETRSFDIRGGVLAQSTGQEFDYPPLGLPNDEAAFWSRVPTIDIQMNTLTDSWQQRLAANGKLRLDVSLRAAQLGWGRGRFGIPVPRWTYARLSGTVSLAWVRQI